MKQDQLRLDFHVKAARRLKKTHQHKAQRYLPERPVKVGLAAGAYRSFKFVNPSALGNPAGFQVQFGNTFVVAPEKCGEVLRKVFLVNFGQRSDDAKVQRDIAAKGRRFQTDLDVAGMHVCMEKPIAKHLGEKYFTPSRASFFISTPASRRRWV